METTMKVTILAQTPDAAKVVAAAARNCYSEDGPIHLFDGLTDEKAEQMLQKIASLGHESVLEHAVFTFAAENVSRTLMAQITRHRLASFSVKSQRYVDENAFDYVLPESVRQTPEAAAIFEDFMKQSADCYTALRGLGVPKEDARFVLPGACTTHIVFTMNARELLHFFKLRCCLRAQWEIRQLAEKMLELCRETAPILFSKAGPSCVWYACSEGKMSCGQSAVVRSRYRPQTEE